VKSLDDAALKSLHDGEVESTGPLCHCEEWPNIENAPGGKGKAAVYSGPGAPFPLFSAFRRTLNKERATRARGANTSHRPQHPLAQ
jgi:hypothetical protein